MGQGLSVLVRTAATCAAVRHGAGGARRLRCRRTRRGARRCMRWACAARSRDGQPWRQRPCGRLAAVRRAIPVAAVLRAGGRRTAGRAAAAWPARRWPWDGVRFRFLHPPPHFPYLGNEAELRAAHRRRARRPRCSPGDIGEVIERDLLRRRSRGAAGRRGAGGAPRQRRLVRSRLRRRDRRAPCALVSSGYGNRFGHPQAGGASNAGERAGAQVLDTAGDGALRVRLRARRDRRRKRDGATHPRLWDAARRRYGASSALGYAIGRILMRPWAGGLRVLELVKAGGWPMIPLLLLSVLALTHHRRARLDPAPQGRAAARPGQGSPRLGRGAASSTRRTSNPCARPRRWASCWPPRWTCATARATRSANASRTSAATSCTGWSATSTRSAPSPRPARCWACSAPWSA